MPGTEQSHVAWRHGAADDSDQYQRPARPVRRRSAVSRLVNQHTACAAQLHALAINPIVYAELSRAFARHEELIAAINALQIKVIETPRPALFLAARAFLQYKRRGGVKVNVLPDFFIGAHAAVEKVPLLTRDVKRYQTYFPTVQLIAPRD
jgi:predicted nucleic acid-binding protein